MLQYLVMLGLIVLLVVRELNHSSTAVNPPEPVLRAPAPPRPARRAAFSTQWPELLGTPAGNLTPVEIRQPLVTVKWATDGPKIPVLGVSVFVNADLLVRLLNSIDYHVDKIVLIQNGRHPLVARTLARLRKENPEWTVEAHPENLGCAGAWNRILEAAPDAPYHIISNDDIAFYPGALRQFALGVERYQKLVAAGASNRVILYPSHGNLMGGSPPWSCFAILAHAVKTIGKFDPNFWPVYHEDYDYMVRMARAGLWQSLIPEAKVQHGWSQGKYEPGMERAAKDQGKVAVLDEYKAQQGRHERGSPYYSLKWGLGEHPGIYDAGNGYWNKTCGPGGVCTPMPHILYPHPFNDSNLPLSFWKFDPEFRRCLQYGDKPKCRYNHRLLSNPHLIPHDIYMPASRRWARRIRRNGLQGEWLPAGALKPVMGAGSVGKMHSQCFVDGCHVFGPDASVDEDFGSFFAFQGTSGFVTYELPKCTRITQMSYHSSVPCDAADAKVLALEVGPGRDGPWRTALTNWTANCSGGWVESPPIRAEAKALRVRVLANNGFEGGTRIAEVNFFMSELPCAGAANHTLPTAKASS
jgi:hypothetical protein